MEMKPEFVGNLLNGIARNKIKPIDAEILLMLSAVHKPSMREIARRLNIDAKTVRLKIPHLKKLLNS